MNLRASMRILPPLIAYLLVYHPLFTDASETIAFGVDDFLSSIGACSAVSRRGENLASTIEATKYLGLRWLRVGCESGIPVNDLIEVHKQIGVRFSYGLMSGGSDLAHLLQCARQLAST